MFGIVFSFQSASASPSPSMSIAAVEFPVFAFRIVLAHLLPSVFLGYGKVAHQTAVIGSEFKTIEVFATNAAVFQPSFTDDYFNRDFCDSPSVRITAVIETPGEDFAVRIVFLVLPVRYTPAEIFTNEGSKLFLTLLVFKLLLGGLALNQRLDPDPLKNRLLCPFVFAMVFDGSADTDFVTSANAYFNREPTLTYFTGFECEISRCLVDKNISGIVLHGVDITGTP